MGMTCTRCFRPAEGSPPTGLPAAVLAKLCAEWKCMQCLDELEAEMKEASDAKARA